MNLTGDGGEVGWGVINIKFKLEAQWKQKRSTHVRAHIVSGNQVGALDKQNFKSHSVTCVLSNQVAFSITSGTV